MDNRVPTTSNAKGEVFAFGKRFPNLAAAERGVAEIIKRRETIAGRKLSAKELREGVAHRDDMDERAKVAAQQWQPTMPVEEAGEQNPFRKARLEPKEPRNRKELMAKAERDYDAKLEREAADADSKADPRRAKARATADELWEQVAFDPTATTSQLVAVEQLQRQASGDLAAYKTMNESIVASRQSAHDKQVAIAQAEAEQALARLNALRPGPAFDGAPGVGPGDKVSRLRDGRGGESIVILTERNTIKKEWAVASDAPPEVQALATEFPN